MPNERNNPQPARPAPRLSDTQLILLSAAAQRDDHCLTATPNLKGGTAQRVAERLIAAGLVREIKAKTNGPVWRRDEETAQSFALKLTAAGLKAIVVGDEAPAEKAVEPTRQSAETARPKAVPHQGGRQPKGTYAPAGDMRQPSECRTPSVPRPGSKAAAIIDLLQRDQGATIEELIAVTGWLPHTTRAALTGLKKRGYEIARTRSDGVTRYAIVRQHRALNDPDDSGDGGVSAAPCGEQAA